MRGPSSSSSSSSPGLDLRGLLLASWPFELLSAACKSNESSVPNTAH